MAASTASGKLLVLTAKNEGIKIGQDGEKGRGICSNFDAVTMQLEFNSSTFAKIVSFFPSWLTIPQGIRLFPKCYFSVKNSRYIWVRRQPAASTKLQANELS